MCQQKRGAGGEGSGGGEEEGKGEGGRERMEYMRENVKFISR